MKAESEIVTSKPDEAQRGNKSWWTSHTMSYDWKDKVSYAQFSLEWFDEIDRRFVEASRHFAHNDKIFGNIIPFGQLKGKRVLEIGCGMGLHTELLARAGADVTAIDLSPKSVEATTKRLALKGIQANVIEMDAEKLAHENEFDFIWSWGVIHHSSRTGLVMRNMFRALKPGGEMRLMVYNLEGMQAYSVIVSRYLIGFWRGASLDELLWKSTDGFLARYFTRDSLTNMCRIFCDDVTIDVSGQEPDAVPLPGKLRALVRPFFSDRYIAKAVRKRGSFLFATARKRDA